MAQDKAVNTEKYQGSGKLVSAIGRSSLLAGVTSVIALPLASIKGGKIFDQLNSLPENKEISQQAFDKLVSKATYRNPVVLVLLALPVVSLIYGLISGARASSKGKAQFEALKSEAEVKDGLITGLQTRITGLETQVSGLHQEVQGHRANFAERHPKKESPAHAPKDHGSHGETVRASQHETAEAARTH